MFDTINLKGIEALISTAAAEQDMLAQENQSHELAIIKNNEKLVILQAKIDAYRDVLNMPVSAQIAAHTPSTPLFEQVAMTTTSAHKSRTYSSRRMRLGAKKRVIYELVRMGVATFDAVNDAVKFSSLDIDQRYVREVFRSGKLDGDFVDGEAGSIVLTPQGIEIMDKAPKPMDWTLYEAAMYEALAPDDEDRYRD